MTMTRGAEKILARMRELVDTGSWEALPSHSPTIRLTRELKTPNYAREPYKGRMALWGQETYTELLFITLVNNQVIVGHGSCPWVGRSDSQEPLWYVEMLLNAEEPWDVVERRIGIKAARKDEYNARQIAKQKAARS